MCWLGPGWYCGSQHMVSSDGRLKDLPAVPAPALSTLAVQARHLRHWSGHQSGLSEFVAPGSHPQRCRTGRATSQPFCLPAMPIASESKKCRNYATGCASGHSSSKKSYIRVRKNVLNRARHLVELAENSVASRTDLRGGKASRSKSYKVRRGRPKWGSQTQG